jgi:hypothetical protein
MNFHIKDSLVVILLMDLKLMHWLLVTADTCNTAIWSLECRVRYKVFTAVKSWFVGLCSVADPEDGDSTFR